MKKIIAALTIFLFFHNANADLPANYFKLLDNFVFQNKACPLNDSRCLKTNDAYNQLVAQDYCLTNPANVNNVKSWSHCPRPPEEQMQIQKSDCTDIIANQSGQGNEIQINLGRADSFGKQCTVTCITPAEVKISDPLAQCQKLTNMAVAAKEREAAQAKQRIEEQRLRETALLRQKAEEQTAFAKQKSEEERLRLLAAKNEAELKEKQDKPYKDLAQKGYVPLTMDDFQLDAKTFPEGKKIYIHGYYEASGDMQYLKKFSSYFSMNQNFEIPLLSDNADRETRKHLMSLQQNCGEGHGAICQLTIIGKVASCTVSFLNVEKHKTCIDVDSILTNITTSTR